MEQGVNTGGAIPVNLRDPRVDALIRAREEKEREFSVHFDQGEDMFLVLSDTYDMPRLPLNHDFRSPRPPDGYREILAQVIDRLSELAPQVFSGTTYYYDPANLFRPAFFQLYSYRRQTFAYLVRVDLQFRTRKHEALEQRDNATSPRYRSRNLFLEADMVPVHPVGGDGNEVKRLQVEQIVSTTFVGERGWGRQREGIWIDRDLAQFFSRLFTSSGKRIHPWYPFSCKYKSISQTVIDMERSHRRSNLTLLQHARAFVRPHMKRIEKALRESGFSTDLEAFKALKAEVPSWWKDQFNGVHVQRFLNDQGDVEFRIEND